MGLIKSIINKTIGSLESENNETENIFKAIDNVQVSSETTRKLDYWIELQKMTHIVGVISLTTEEFVELWRYRESCRRLKVASLVSTGKRVLMYLHHEGYLLISYPGQNLDSIFCETSE